MNKSLVITSALVLVVLISSHSFAQPREFKSDSGKFVIMTPCELKESTHTEDWPSGKVVWHTFSCADEQSGRICFIRYADLPHKVIQRWDSDYILNMVRDTKVNFFRGKVVNETKINLDRNPGREFLVDGTLSSGKEVTSIVRIFLAGNRIYEVFAVAARGQAMVSAREFLNSFKFSGLATSGSVVPRGEFKSEPGRFSVVAPCTLTEKISTSNWLSSKVDWHLFLCLDEEGAGTMAWGIRYCDLPVVTLRAYGSERIIDEFRDQEVFLKQDKVVREDEITIDGNRGREVVKKGKLGTAQDVTLKLRIFLAGNRIYGVFGITARGEGSAPVLDNFLNSFKLVSR
jgi:hypothetical protein